MESYLTAEISAAAVKHNLSLLRNCIGPSVKLCAVVKADCYGHGTDMLLELLSQYADCLGVATPEEAIHLRRMGYKRAIHTFFSACAYAEGSELRDALEELIVLNVTLTVVAEDELLAVAEAAKKVSARARVHVKVDTGMGRSGIPAGETPQLVDQIRRRDELELTGLYTHFASADEADKSFTRGQLERFMETVSACRGRSSLTLHAANSAATIDMPQTHLDMVRPGIAIYGYQPSEQMLTRLPLRPALRLWGRLMQIKRVPAGSRCGYGLTHTFDKPSVVGLVPVGYGDGYPRSLSNKAAMKIRGKVVPIRGRVSMDQVIVDLTALENIKVGEQVEIISSDAQSPNSVAGLAELAGTIPYEITCRLGTRVRRKLVDYVEPGCYQAVSRRIGRRRQAAPTTERAG